MEEEGMKKKEILNSLKTQDFSNAMKPPNIQSESKTLQQTNERYVKAGVTVQQGEGSYVSMAT